MAPPKSIGVLITTHVILLLGESSAAFLRISAFISGKEFTEDIKKSESFMTPKTLSHTIKQKLIILKSHQAKLEVFPNPAHILRFPVFQR